jgi:hypothetical protein
MISFTNFLFVICSNKKYEYLVSIVDQLTRAYVLVLFSSMYLFVYGYV